MFITFIFTKKRRINDKLKKMSSSKFDTHEPSVPSGNEVASCVLELFDNHPPILESFQKEYKS